MLKIADVTKFLATFAPISLAESWDNVGLLIGDESREVTGIITCLTITPPVVQEAIAAKANLIVAHHPLPFKPLKNITSATADGALLLQVIESRIAVYSPHTAFDSAAEGINQRLAEGIGLQNVQALVPGEDGLPGSGRYGVLPASLSLSDLCQRVKTFLKIESLQHVGVLDRRIQKLAVACGSAGEFLVPARTLGCECLITGEVRFHTALEAEATEMALVLAGHYASERFGVEVLAGVLLQQFPSTEIWASRAETDPIRCA